MDRATSTSENGFKVKRLVVVPSLFWNFCQKIARWDVRMIGIFGFR